MSHTSCLLVNTSIWYAPGTKQHPPPPLVLCAENTIRHRSQIERRRPDPSPRTLNHGSGMPRRLPHSACPIRLYGSTRVLATSHNQPFPNSPILSPSQLFLVGIACAPVELIERYLCFAEKVHAHVTHLLPLQKLILPDQSQAVLLHPLQVRHEVNVVHCFVRLICPGAACVQACVRGGGGTRRS